MTRLIDADALKEKISYRQWDVDDDLPRDEASIRISECYVVAGMVDEMPAVDAVPVRHGCWSEHKDYPGLAWLCSECGNFTTVRSYYCPNCGARMDEK